MTIRLTQKKIKELRRQVSVTEEDVSRCRMEIDSMARAANTDRAWAKEELNKKKRPTFDGLKRRSITCGE